MSGAWSGELGKDERRRHHEVAAVPEMAGLDVAFRRRRVRLFDEGRHPVDAVDARQRLVALDIAVARRGMGRPDAEGDDGALGSGPARRPNGLAEALDVPDQVVGGEEQEDRVRIVARDPLGGSGNRGGGVARLRLEQEPSGHAGLGQSRREHVAMVAIGDDQRRPEQARLGDAMKRRGEGGDAANEGQERLRPRLAGERPEPCAGAAAHDDRNDHWRFLRHHHVVAAHPPGGLIERLHSTSVTRRRPMHPRKKRKAAPTRFAQQRHHLPGLHNVSARTNIRHSPAERLSRPWGGVLSRARVFSSLQGAEACLSNVTRPARG